MTTIKKFSILIENIDWKMILLVVYKSSNIYKYNSHDIIRLYVNSKKFIANCALEIFWMFKKFDDYIDWKMILLVVNCFQNLGNIIE